METEEVDIFNSQDLDNLNVNVWFNRIESRLQYCLAKDDVKDGFLQYKMLINHAELIAISSGKMKEQEYEQEVDNIVSKTELRGDEISRELKKAMIKYKIILKHLLKTKKTDLNLNYSG